jgi:transcriptional antiterminator RfaH
MIALEFRRSRKLLFDSRGIEWIRQKNWYLAQLKPNGFQAAMRNLGRQGIPTFMPLRTLSSRKAGIVSAQKKPIFPGYLFVQLDPGSASWRSVNSTLGVARLVAFGNSTAQPLPENLMLALAARCDEDDCLLPPDDFKIGEHARAISGPFLDFVVEIETIPDAKRIGVLFEIMGRTVRAVIPRHNLEHAKPRK